MKKIPFTVLFMALCLFPSCNQDEGICTTDLTARVNTGFYVRGSLKDRDTLLSDFSLYGTLRPDSLIYDSVRTQKIEFPLPSDNPGLTSFVFRAGDVTDTLQIMSEPRLVMVSFACGFAANHTIKQVFYQNTLIDTIIISDPNVDLEKYENLKIYIKPAVAVAAAF